MNHTTALCNATDMTNLSANCKFNGNFFNCNVGCHNGFSSKKTTVVS